MRFSKSFVSGMAKSAELFPHPEDRRKTDAYTGMKKDCQALRGDWINVGNDLRKGIKRFYKRRIQIRFPRVISKVNLKRMMEDYIAAANHELVL